MRRNPISKRRGAASRIRKKTSIKTVSRADLERAAKRRQKRMQLALSLGYNEALDY